MLSRLLMISFVVSVGFSFCTRSSSNNNTVGNTAKMKKKTDAVILELISQNKPRLKDGDLVQRTDDDFVSETLRDMSVTDKTYSHCGFAFLENGQWMVYNNMAGEENKLEKMMREPFDSFVSPNKKTGFGIFRYDLSDSELTRLHKITTYNYDKGLKFDKTFDLKTDDKMYCAEMIYKFLIQATNGRVVLPTTKKTNFRPKDPKYKGTVLKEFEYVAMDNLNLNPFCKEISRVSYKQ